MNLIINCPKCNWIPAKNEEWECESCGVYFNVFERTDCPQCAFEVQNVHCKEPEGGCGEVSPYLDWFGGMDDALKELNIEKRD